MEIGFQKMGYNNFLYSNWVSFVLAKITLGSLKLRRYISEMSIPRIFYPIWVSFLVVFFTFESLGNYSLCVGVLTLFLINLLRMKSNIFGCLLGYFAVHHVLFFLGVRKSSDDQPHFVLFGGDEPGGLKVHIFLIITPFFWIFETILLR